VDVGGSSPSVPTIIMIEATKHPVLEEIERRKAGESPQLKLALAVEGGGIRSTVSAGGVCALASSEIGPQIFDSIFGSSGGSYVAGYYLSENQTRGATVFYENNNGGEFIDIRQVLLRQRPVLSLDHILNSVLVDKKPIDFQKIIDSKKLHILATHFKTLRRHIFEPSSSVEELRLQLRAGSTIPALAGPPVEIEGDLYIDAAVSEPMPYKAAVDSGFDGVLLLSSRPNNAPVTSRNDVARKLISLAFARQIKGMKPELLELIKNRSVLDAHSLEELKEKTENPQEPPFVFSIHPPDGLEIVNQLEKTPKKIIGGTIAGYLAVKRAFEHREPNNFNTKAEFFGIY
jgi:predicted patatin/cPLA2 family phospholipase